MTASAGGHFDAWAPTYDNSRVQRWIDDLHIAMLDALPSEFQPASILDIGCGTGRLLRRAATRWPQARLYGVDFADGMIEQARRLTRNATFLTAPAESLPIEDQSIDLALSSLSIHHWSDQRQGLSELSRVLNTSGRWGVADIVYPQLIKPFVRGSRVMTMRTMAQSLTAASLRIERRRPIFLGVVQLFAGDRFSPASARA